MNKRILFSWNKYTSILMLCLIAVSCQGKKEKETRNTQKETSIPVETAQTLQTSILDTQTFSATVEAMVSNNIATPTGGRIKRILVEVGQNVRKGQLLAEMDNSTLRQADIQLQEQKNNYARIDELYRVGGISKSEWEARKRALDLAQNSFENILENTQLRSPINGVITKRNYNAGDVMSPSLPLFTVEQLNPVKLRVNLSEIYYPIVKKGMPVTVTSTTLPGETFSGSISLIHPTINPQSHAFVAEIQVNNPQNKLTAGMYAQVSLSLGERTAIMVNDRSVIKQKGSAERYVFVVKEDGRAYRQDVQIGISQGNQIEILSGLAVGQTIVTEGAAVLKDGSLITVATSSFSK